MPVCNMFVWQMSVCGMFISGMSVRSNFRVIDELVYGVCCTGYPCAECLCA